MTMILSKKQMTKEGIKLHFIMPALNAVRWKNGVNITMETRIIDEKISLKGSMACLEKPQKADCLPNINKYHPIAPFRALGMTMNITDGWRPCKGQLDYYGNEIEDHICNNRDFDYNVILADMVREAFLRVNE